MTSPMQVVGLFCASLVWAANAAAAESELDRGAYLVRIAGCADCHAPLKVGPDGTRTDLSRGLSGHPQDLTLPPPPAPQGPWSHGASTTNTAFYGRWGVSYAANLTPDKSTGIGSWKADDFVIAMRTGKHIGVGRPILPPMPWHSLAQMTEPDLRAMYAYLMAQPAVTNVVPEPVGPPRP